MVGPRGLKVQAPSISKRLRYDTSYLNIARVVAALSHDRKVKVGCIIVRSGQILSQGWNGAPSGMSNNTRTDAGTTYSWIIHSEANALMKLAKNGGGSEGATIYCTHSPCMDCALLILQAGITRIVYSEVYCKDSIAFLKERGLDIECIDTSNGISDSEGGSGKR